MAHRNGVDIQRAYDTAARGAPSDPVTRKLMTTLPGSGQKCSGNRAGASKVIEVVSRDARRRLLTQRVTRTRSPRHGMEK
jgi:hypothetical protein